jgi:flagellar hook-length control protein FliK
MADSNSLVLLPPRITAQAPQDASTSKTQKPSSDETFEQKLEKAKKHKAHTTVKKQIAETPAKVATAKTPAAKPAAKTATDVTADSKKPTNTAQKSLQTLADAVDESAEKESAETDDTKKLPVPAEQAAVADAAAKKLPVKATKTVAKSTQPAGDPKLTNAHPADTHKIVKDATSDDESDSSDAKPTVTVKAVNDDADADTDGGDAADAEFGTGKVVTAGVGHKNASNASAGDDSGADSNASASASEAALEAAISGSVATAIGTSTAKTTSQSGVQAVGDTSAVSALAIPTATGTAGAIGKTSATAATPQAQFAEDNHPKIISSIQGKLLPNGGTLQMRLDPPGLGDLQVTVHLKDGVMTASFATSSDEATKLLSHSLGTLKSGLEAAGVTVDKIRVEQAPKKDSSGNSDGESNQGSQDQQQQAQQDQQRREMVKQMWKKLAGGDPLDLVA